MPVSASGDERAEIHVIAGGVGADLQRLDARHELLDQPVGGILADRHRHRDRHAALARGAIARADQRVDGLVHVGVGHDHHVVLGAAEALHALAVAAQPRVDILRDRGRADEADRRCRDVENAVDRFLVAVDDIQDTRRQARLEHQFGQHQRHRGVALGRLQDEGVAAGDAPGRISTSGSWRGS
jgi:hypothetical protein